MRFFKDFVNVIDGTGRLLKLMENVSTKFIVHLQDVAGLHAIILDSYYHFACKRIAFLFLIVARAYVNNQKQPKTSQNFTNSEKIKLTLFTVFC